MAQKKVTGAARSTTGPNLQNLRAQIDKIDQQILKSINDRARLCVEIGKVKNSGGVEVFNPGREDEVLSKIVGQNKGPLDDRGVRAIYRELMSASRAVQRRHRVAYLGPAYSFSHLASIEKFGESVEYVPVGSIAGAFEAVHRKQVDVGVVPIENSTDGRIADTLDMFTRFPMKICAEVSLRIHHNLLAACPQSEVRRVYSKPQVLSQCRHWLATNVPQAQLKEVASSTTAVQLAKQEPGAAAVASRQAAVAYGLDVICADIEDFQNNITRFAVISHHSGDKTGSDKTAIMFHVTDYPGALCDALLTFKKNKVNMSWIESFPAKSEGKSQEYVFFADIAGHSEEARVKRTLSQLERKCRQLVVLGTFPKSVCHE